MGTPRMSDQALVTIWLLALAFSIFLLIASYGGLAAIQDALRATRQLLYSLLPLGVAYWLHEIGRAVLSQLRQRPVTLPVVVVVYGGVYG